MNENELLKETLEVWCPNYPRQVATKMDTKRGWGQVSANNELSAIKNLKSVKYKAPGFVSVYSFPNGHTSDDGENIPCIDTLMFDFDFEGGPDDSMETWARDMSALLTRTRMIAKRLISIGKAKYWRASLSGHKGVHLYLDFPAIEPSNGSEAQFRNGMRSYTENVIDALTTETGLSDLPKFLDVSSGKDLARLTRLPNTIHDSASKRFGELRYCVPVTIEELAEIRPSDYVELTRSQRPITEGMRRTENERAGQILTKEIRMASSGFTARSSGSYDASRVEQYEKQTNDKVTLDKVKFHLSNKPCIWAFRESGEMFKKGQESHIMELNCIAAMVKINAPIETMVEFFNVTNEFSKEYTEEKVKDLIARNYNEFNCSTIINQAESFCLKNSCNIYNNAPDLQELSSY